MNAVKKWVRSNDYLHARLKFTRDLGGFIRSGTSVNLGRLRDIASIYNKTMLPPARLENICDVVESINAEGIAGDIVECGVWSGGALALFALRDMKFTSSRRRYIGFDSFEGLPPPTPEDDAIYTIFNENSRKQGRLVSNRLRKTGVCVGDSADSVRQFFQRVHIPPDRSVFHVGWFQESLPKAAPSMGPLAVLRVDGDWYDSTKVSLEHLYSLVSPGGYVIIDDYGAFPGCKRAVDEFRESAGLTDQLNWVDEHCVWFRKPA
jgi:hypothetical protein